MTIGALIVLAIVDSINPSAIVVTLYLLSRPNAGPQVAVYITAIVLTYFSLGVAMILGAHTLVPSLGAWLDSPRGLVGQALIGLALLMYSLTASSQTPATVRGSPATSRTLAALFLLGVSVTAMELPTALPYLAAIALLTSADLSMPQRALLLAAYTLIFVMPPVVLLVGHLAMGASLRERYDALRQRVQRGARDTALWVAGLVGGALLATSLIELIARRR